MSISSSKRAQLKVNMHVRGLENEKVTAMQGCRIDNLGSEIPTIVAFAVRAQRLEPLRGASSDVGSICRVQELMREGDIYAAEVTASVGTLVTKWINQN